MSPAPKTNREPVPEDTAEKTAVRDDIAALFLHGVERSAEAQKHWVTLAAQQNAEMIEVWKKAAEKTPVLPHLPMLDVTIGAVNSFADIQKSAIEFVAEQTRVWTDMLKDRAGNAKKAVESTTNIARQTMESSFAVQKKALEHTAVQTKAVVDAARQQFGFKGRQADAITDTFQRSVETIVDAQKELLGLVTH